MWGGTPSRNMVSDMKGLPTTWDLKTGKNVKGRRARLAVIWQSDGRRRRGDGRHQQRGDARSEAGRRSRRADGVQRETGEFMWQATFEKLVAGRANDWPFQGIASSPLIMRGSGLLHVEPRQIIAADLRASTTARTTALNKDEKLTGKTDIGHHLDLRHDGGGRAFPHNLANCSPVIDGGLLYRSTGNGQDESHVNAVAEGAVDHRGRDRERQAAMGRQLGRRSHPARAVVDAGGGRHRRRAPGGARAGRRLGARLRGAERQEAREFDTNPKDSLWPKTRNEVISTPVVVDNVVYTERPGPRARRGRRTRLRD